MADKSFVLSVFLALISYQAVSAFVHDELIFGLSGWNGKARTARKLVHEANWTTMATVSVNSAMAGIPMVNLVAVADSPIGGDSTGNIYFYISGSGLIAQNINALNNVTALFAKDDDLDCPNQNQNSITPSCAYVVVSGTVTQLYQGSQQYNTAQSAILSRHPVSTSYIQNNNFYLCQLIIGNIFLIDSDGLHNISVQNFYNDKAFGILDLAEKTKIKKQFLKNNV